MRVQSFIRMIIQSRLCWRTTACPILLAPRRPKAPGVYRLRTYLDRMLTLLIPLPIDDHLSLTHYVRPSFPGSLYATIFL